MHRRLQFARPHGLANFSNERAALAAMPEQFAGLDRSSRATSSVCANAIALLRVPIRKPRSDTRSPFECDQAAGNSEKLRIFSVEMVVDSGITSNQNQI